jgi:hypothetical protein
VEAKPQNFIRSVARRRKTPRLSAVLILLLAVTGARAQLAITEVMSSAAATLGTDAVDPKSDFWELTNFGTNTIALEGYTYSDNVTSYRVGDAFVGCSIGPGESIIFLRRDTITNRQDFFDWWGANNLSTNLQVRQCPKTPGFDKTRDAVNLFNPQGNWVDGVEVGKSVRGHTFVYDAQTGEFGTFSVLGANRAFKAVQADDYGSPGLTTGPIPISILQQPSSATQDAGLDVEFTVRAAGMPRPFYQWFFNGVALTGATAPNLTVSNIQPGHAGDYTVRVTNGVHLLVSAAATLTVNTNPLPVDIVVPPSDAVIFEGQTNVFSVKVRGFPPPAFQWQSNGVSIPRATNNSFEVGGATLAMNGTIYTVRVTNLYGSTNASARLGVTKPPLLAITEVMAGAAGGSGSGHEDWFELTNLDTNTVNLRGYRFSDGYAIQSAFRITNALVIEPGESIIFVERLTGEEFQDWWGRDRLPAGIKITTYSGLGLSSEDGDVINFWNSAEFDPYSPVAYAAFLRSTRGFSLQAGTDEYYYLDTDSIAGVGGAFHAASSGDVGSPGYITNPSPRFVCVTRDESQVILNCRVIDGKQYSLQSKARLTDPAWVTVGTYPATNSVIMILQPGGAGGSFFQMKEVP